MTQKSIVVSTTPPLPGLSLVNQVNDALEALGTDFSGPDDPAAFTKPFMTWADTGNMLLKRRNAAGTAWVTICPLFEELATKSAASETDAGIIKLATQGEVDAGVDDTKSVTPKKLRFGVSWLFGANGYLALPNWLGGFILQWGQYVNTGGGLLVSYPIPFPNSSYALIPIVTNTGVTGNFVAVVISRTINNFNIHTYSGGTNTLVPREVNFIALGR